MLFNSYEFMFFCLPITVLTYHLLYVRRGARAGVAFLVAASLIFYAWWDVRYLPILCGSIAFNFFFARILTARALDGRPNRALLAAGILINSSALCWFKYAGFLAWNLSALTNLTISFSDIALPLAISFFTFQQIAFLVDAGRARIQNNFLHYSLFVTFFPHLIAGPITHHGEMMPQFDRQRGLLASDAAIGLTIFAIGLFKKAVLADGIAPSSDIAFGAAEEGEALSFFAAWGGALAYTFQLYFDFSGYSDMAIGAARMFGVRLPINFDSPYKSRSIIDFWRRWHMTLSRYLREYLYIPMGGSRLGPTRRHLNLMATMLIGGLWHGAGWTFVIWGGLHGLFLVANHLWRQLRPRSSHSKLAQVIGWAFTFLAVVFAWVFFRAASWDAAINVASGMVGLNGAALPAAIAYRLPEFVEAAEAIGVSFSAGGGSDFVHTWLWIVALFLIAVAAPNTQEIMRNYAPALNFGEKEGVKASTGPLSWLTWKPSVAWSLATAMFVVGGALTLAQPTAFLYFQF